MNKCEFVIVGSGIVGLAIAKELISSGYKDILILDKEDRVGRHASGRNSGILHAGVYYTPDSLKASFCLEGNQLMKSFCKEKGLSCLETGKVIVAKNEKEVPIIDTLFKRASQNGATVKKISEKELSSYEPLAKTTEVALHVQETAIISPKEILSALVSELESSSCVRFQYNTEFLEVLSDNKILTSQGEIGFDYLINAAGTFSDKIAHGFGVGLDYRLIPFKGIYKKLTPHLASQVKGNIYPVPDLENPFLGLHFSRSATGDVYIGPTAMPAFSSEAYSLKTELSSETLSILWMDAILFLRNPKFRRVALTEPKRYIDHFFYKESAELVHTLSKKDILPATKMGIRPQLINWKTKELEMDFIVEKGKTSFHVLNAISPAFTSAFSFAKYCVSKISI